MNTKDQSESTNIRKTKIVFWVNLAICAISVIVLIYSLNSRETWRIFASSIGFVIFLSLTLVIFWQMIKLQKENKGQ